MKQKREQFGAVDLLSVKETAYILRISPKTIYNRLWKGDFPLVPIRVPWNRRELFFQRKEVIAMVQMRTPTKRSALLRMLESIREPVRPVAVALHGSLPTALEGQCAAPLKFRRLDTTDLPGWRTRHDLLLIQRRHATIFLAAATAEHFRAAALLAAAVAVAMGQR